jgi:hypothetical protein
MKIRISLLIFTFGASLVYSQAVQAPDATITNGNAVTAFQYSMPAAMDPEVLPGCMQQGPAAAPTYDCNVQIKGWIYFPTNGLTGTLPVILFLHGNHASCGTIPPAGNPIVEGTISLVNLIAAGNQFTGNGTCPAGLSEIPSDEGYDYLAFQLARLGYIVDSIDNNRGITGLIFPAPGVAGDDVLIRARGVMVLKTLQMLANVNAVGGAGYFEDLEGHLDFTNVGLMGHSRGGEGVRAAFNLFNGAVPTPGNLLNPWPGRLPGLNIRAIFEIAPTDAGMGVPTGSILFNARGTVWNVLLPDCDGDVSDLSGARPFDRAIMNLEATPIQKSTYTVWGANHNFFNTNWNDNDSPGCIGFLNTPIFAAAGTDSTEQQAVAMSSLLALMRGNVGAAADVTFNRNFNPPFGIPAMANGAVFPTAVDRGYSPPGAISTFDDFTAAGVNSVSHVAHVTPNVVVANGTVPNEDPVISQAAAISWATANAANFFQTSWTANGAPGININPANFQTLDIRVSRQPIAANVPNGVGAIANGATTNFSVQLVGANGVMTREVAIAPFVDPNFAGANLLQKSAIDGPVGGAAGGLHPILHTVRIPLSAFGNFAAIAPQLHGVRLVFDQSAKGAIFVTNIRLSTMIGGGAAAYPPLNDPAATYPTSTAPTSAPATVYKAKLVSVLEVSSAPELDGAEGYRFTISLSDTGATRFDEARFMVVGTGTAPPLGNALTTSASYPSNGNIVFTLPASQYITLPASVRVIVQYGKSSTPGEYWDCGTVKLP